MDIELRVGRGLEGFILSKLRSAERRIVVVSPWISERTAMILVERARSGVDVKLYTSDDTANTSHAAGLLSLFERRVEGARSIPLIVSGSLSAVIGTLLMVYSPFDRAASIFAGFWLAVLGFVLLFLGISMRKAVWVSRIGDGLRIYETSREAQIHAKIYVADDWLGIGSVNFTVMGLKSNLESFIWIRDEGLVEEALAAIESAFSRERPVGYEKALGRAIAVTSEAKRRKPRIFIPIRWRF